jgi:hypothetical protein
MMLDTEMPVKKFALWWLRNGKPTNHVPDAVTHVGDFSGVTLFREGPFQAQLFIVRPNGKSPVHTHPNVDSVEYGLAGDGQDSFTSERHAKSGPFYMIAPGEAHTAAAGCSGGAFISFQKWLNGKPTSIEKDWIGDLLDERHLIVR